MGVPGRGAAEGVALTRVSPNPSRGVTRIEYELPQAGNVRIRVHDLQGRVVASLVDEAKPAGRYVTTWSASRSRDRARAGIYFVSLEAAGRTAMRRVALTE